MFVALLIIIAPLCNFANGATEAINVCNVPMPGVRAGAIVQRPSVPVENCQDRDALACYELFKPGDNDGEIGMAFNENRME
ncbi:unnamed protein product [Dracunculus medinensis]|uniref:Secreted protein n=1 Tax=Dracunculus medinensis TaxID=318479 RepID=A0A0N4URT3_DRAME|nr:unnamed protein product [Dracunculus medinensis]